MLYIARYSLFAPLASHLGGVRLLSPHAVGILVRWASFRRSSVMLTSRPVLAWIHLIAGVAGLLAFLATGLFMDRSLAHLVGMPDAPRVLYRSAHIYLLFSALLNVVLGSYLVLHRGAWGKGCQYVGSLLLLGSVVMFLYGFVIETPLGQIERPVIREAIYFCLAGVLIHAIASFTARAAAGGSAKGTPQDRAVSTAPSSPGCDPV